MCLNVLFLKAKLLILPKRNIYIRRVTYTNTTVILEPWIDWPGLILYAFFFWLAFRAGPFPPQHHVLGPLSLFHGSPFIGTLRCNLRHTLQLGHLAQARPVGCLVWSVRGVFYVLLTMHKPFIAITNYHCHADRAPVLLVYWATEPTKPPKDQPAALHCSLATWRMLGQSGA